MTLEIANFQDLTDKTIFHGIPVMNSSESPDKYCMVIRMSDRNDLTVVIDKHLRNEDQVLVNIISSRGQFQFIILLSEMGTYEKFLDAISHITNELT